jgi:hypothetical protein
VVFLSTQPDSFDPASAPVARAAASQMAFALQSAALRQALEAQAARLRELLDDPAAAWKPRPELEGLRLEPLPAPAEEAEIAVPALRPVGATEAPPEEPPVAEPTRPLAPTYQPPEPVLPEAAPAEIPEIQRPAARPLWRRAAIPAMLVLVTVCGAAVLARGPLTNMAATLFGGSATDTAPAATQTAPVILAASATPQTPPTSAPTEAPPTTAAPPTNTLPPPTATRTAEPTETDTPAETSTPTITPTPPLPPDVVAVALVNLPEGIGGRLRDAPNGNVIGGVPGNTEVHVLDGRETTPDGIAWVRIRIPDTGQTGWFAEDLLIYQDEPGG